MFNQIGMSAKLRGSTWMGPSLALPLLVSLVLPGIGLVFAIVYSVLNTAGYWVFISGRRHNDRLARLAKGAASLGLPVGLPLVLVSDGHNVVDNLDTDAAIAAQQVRPQLF